MKITPVNPGTLARPPMSEGALNGEKSFGDVLRDAVAQMSSLQKDADVAAERLATGEITDIHQVMIAGEKASLALQMTIQIRNKILDAYHEIMRMQV